jgi:hypothetical protein
MINLIRQATWIANLFRIKTKYQVVGISCILGFHRQSLVNNLCSNQLYTNKCFRFVSFWAVRLILISYFCRDTYKIVFAHF